jgi:hypothetical protein
MSEKMEVEMVRLATNMEHMQDGMKAMAETVGTIAKNQDKILEIQLQHQTNAQQIEENREALHTLVGKCEIVQLAVAENTAFRNRLSFWLVKFLTPVVTIAAGGLTIAAFSGLLS